MAAIGSLKPKHAIIAFLAATLLVATYIFVARPKLQEFGATTYGPLSAPSKNGLGIEGEYLLAELPPLSALSDDSLRFVAMPQIRKRWMAVSLSKEDGRVHGRLVVLDREAVTLTKRTFQMRASDFNEFTKRWDAQSQNYWGEIALVFDGTVVGFERKRGRVVTAGVGNSLCHAALSNLAAVYIGRQAEELNDLRARQSAASLKSDSC